MYKWMLITGLCLVCNLSQALEGSSKYVGIVGPTTGPLAGEFSAFLNPLLDLLEPRDDLEVVVIDDQCRRDLAQAAADELINEAADVVIGHYCSAATYSALPLYAANNIPLLAAHATHPKVTQVGGSTLIRLRMDETQWLDSVMQTLRLTAEDKVLVLSEGEAIRKRLAALLVERLGGLASMHDISVGSPSVDADIWISFVGVQSLAAEVNRLESDNPLVVYAAEAMETAAVVQLPPPPWSTDVIYAEKLAQLAADKLFEMLQIDTAKP